MEDKEFKYKGGFRLNTHLHITAWALAVILTIVTTVLYQQHKDKVAKIFHMILRLLYIVILISGVQLLWIYFESMHSLLIEALIKSFAGLWLIVAMEMISVNASKRRPTKSGWIQFAIAFLITLLLGFGRLPLGILP